METGWTCSGGSKTKKDFCKEICGDGLDFGTYECDDGNYNNNDGCDKYCRVEAFYTCSGGTKSRPDICTPLPPFYIKNVSIN